MFAEVIIPLSVGGTFTYSIPDTLQADVCKGSLVMVPFAGNKRYTALVIAIHDRKPDGFEIKGIDSIAEKGIRFSDKHIEFIEWIADYYGAFPGDVLRAALPVAFRLESVSYVELSGEASFENSSFTHTERRVVDALSDGNSYTVAELQKLTSIKGILPAVKSLLDRGVVVVKEVVDPLFKPRSESWINFKGEFNDDLWRGLKRAAMQSGVMQLFKESGVNAMPRSLILQSNPNYAAAIRELCKKGILEVENREVMPISGCEECVPSNSLNPAQNDALQSINSLFEKFGTILLHGVTSSGKTEVYIKLIEQVIAQGKCVLFMLPEIALTIQIIKRLKRVFGGEVGVYHSGMSDRERAEVWRRQSGDNPYKLLLGVRSSLFLPHNNLGLIIVDEEHDTSYKQREPSPRYNGRDSALMLAKMCGAKALLGSATPSFESYRNAIGAKFGLVELTQRHGNFVMPRVELADLADARRRKVMCGNFTPLLVKEMRRVLSEGGQVILFQDRRGYSTFVRCDKCGHVPQCPACDVSMTYYKGDNRMMCRYCGRIFTIATHCSECTDGTYRMGRAGTEKIEEEIAKLFPDYPVDRIDTDSMSNKSRFRESIANFESGKTRILVGTRMIAKGLDFGGVKLVGVIDADTLIHLPDFRAEERAFAQLLQVSGRCGRRGNDGVVIIQTAEPKREIFEWVKQCDYYTMFNTLAAERKEFGYPPFTKAIGVEFRHKDRNVVRGYANNVVKFLRLKLGATAVEGPAEPDVARIGNMYRVTLLLKLTDYNHFRLAKFSLDTLAESRDKSIRVIVDIDTY
ncbi:MAG: primosomal protein N' [Marinifilaceae bacterium]|nr:primosomal protein N' [Marinifilaceae bacterium]